MIHADQHLRHIITDPRTVETVRMSRAADLRPPTRLSAFYAAIFLVTGIQLPFWPVWLASRGLTAREIGVLLAAAIWVKVLATPRSAPSVGDGSAAFQQVAVTFSHSERATSELCTSFLVPCRPRQRQARKAFMLHCRRVSAAASYGDRGSALLSLWWRRLLFYGRALRSWVGGSSGIRLD